VYSNTQDLWKNQSYLTGYQWGYEVSRSNYQKAQQQLKLMQDISTSSEIMRGIHDGVLMGTRDRPTIRHRRYVGERYRRRQERRRAHARRRGIKYPIRCVCCSCKQDIGIKWTQTYQPNAVSHGYCTECTAVQNAKIDRYLERTA